MVVVVFAGCAGGLGSELMDRLLRDGAWHGAAITHLIAVEHFRDAAGGAALRQRLTQALHERCSAAALTVLEWDAAKMESSVALATELEKVGGGRVDVLFVAAGLGFHDDLRRTSVAEYARVGARLMAVNATGPSLLTLACLRQMTHDAVPHTTGRLPPTVIVLSSFSGMVGLPHRAAYCSSKFALNGFLESAFAAFRNVRFVVACPTSVATAFRENWRRELGAPTEGAAVRVNKADMSPRECVDAVWAVSGGPATSGRPAEFLYLVMPGWRAQTSAWITRVPLIGGSMRVRLLRGIAKL